MATLTPRRLGPSDSLGLNQSTADRYAFTSAEGADVVHVLAAHAALPPLLEGLFLEDVGLSLSPLHTHTRKNEIQAQLETRYSTEPDVATQCVGLPTLGKQESLFDLHPRA